nr:MAG TPA: hypothetical protein [Caudoviricetes sp.]
MTFQKTFVLLRCQFKSNTCIKLQHTNLLYRL